MNNQICSCNAVLRRTRHTGTSYACKLGARNSVFAYANDKARPRTLNHNNRAMGRELWRPRVAGCLSVSMTKTLRNV